MRLHRCLNVLNFLVEQKMIDERQIWCYAQMKSKIKIKKEPIKLYGLVLVTVKHDWFFLYNTEYNSTKLELFYSCKIAEMENVQIHKKLITTILCFSNGEEYFQLEMDDWKRFSNIFLCNSDDVAY